MVGRGVSPDRGWAPVKRPNRVIAAWPLDDTAVTDSPRKREQLGGMLTAAIEPVSVAQRVLRIGQRLLGVPRRWTPPHRS